jgi:hypothetical protein
VLGKETGEIMSQSNSTSYWIIPTDAGYDEMTMKSFLRLLENKIFGFQSLSMGRAKLTIDDRICFYSARMGIVADARVSSKPILDRSIIGPFYPYIFGLEDVSVYVENPKKLDSSLRRRLDAFSGKDPEALWSWFIRIAHKVTEHDFKILTNGT